MFNKSCLTYRKFRKYKHHVKAVLKCNCAVTHRSRTIGLLSKSAAISVNVIEKTEEAEDMRIR